MASLDGALQVKVGTFFGRELIIITDSKMEVQTWFMGFMIGRRKFDAELVRQVRYEEWTERGVRVSGIRFKYDGRPHVLVKTLLQESDSLRTVVRIINVYKFSHTIPSGEVQLPRLA